MGIEILYHHKVLDEDLPKISSVWKNNLRRAIENKLGTSPEIFGIPLRNSLKGYRKLRVGDYRIVFRFEDRNKIIIFYIQHRSVVYKNNLDR